MSTICATAGLPVPRPRPRRPAPHPGAVPVRLTRRGRLVLAALSLVLVVLSAGAVGGLPAIAGTGDTAPVAGQHVTVRPGETLWSIALRTAPQADPRQTVAHIIDLNALESSAVQAGSVLLVPAR